MINSTSLDDNTFTKELLDKAVFFEFAEGGAMGAPGEILFFTEDGRFYRSNYCVGKLSFKTVKEAFPVITECRFGVFGFDSATPGGWEYISLGLGNHLLVRSDYYVKFAPLIADLKSPFEIQLNWPKIAQSLIDTQ